MGGWAPLPEEIDLPAYEAWQDREIQLNPKGLMSRLRRWVGSHKGLTRRFSVALATGL